jgi:hypothetical protein
MTRYYFKEIGPDQTISLDSVVLENEKSFIDWLAEANNDDSNWKYVPADEKTWKEARLALSTTYSFVFDRINLPAVTAKKIVVDLAYRMHIHPIILWDVIWECEKERNHNEF